MFGPHVNRTHASGKRPNISKHIAIALREAKAEGLAAKAAAVFLSGPKKMEITIQPDESAELKAYISQTSTVVIAHSAYPTVKVWRDDPFTIKFVRQELAACGAAGVAGLVIHLGGQKPNAV